MHTDQNPTTRHRVQLPTGKADRGRLPRANPPPPAARTTRRGTPICPEPLHVCLRCYGELVYPLDWAEAGPVHWRVVLRCPECEAGEGIFPQAVVERLDIELDRGPILLRDLQHSPTRTWRTRSSSSSARSTPT